MWAWLSPLLIDDHHKALMLFSAAQNTSAAIIKVGLEMPGAVIAEQNDIL